MNGMKNCERITNIFRYSWVAFGLKEAYQYGVLTVFLFAILVELLEVVGILLRVDRGFSLVLHFEHDGKKLNA